MFGILWCATFGKLHFWLLPNLTADCGFFESFVPVYEYTMSGKTEAEAEEQNEGDNENSKSADGEGNDEYIEESKNECLDQNNSEKNGERNKDNDEGESWVKVTKSDVETETQIDNKDSIKC